MYRISSFLLCLLLLGGCAERNVDDPALALCRVARKARLSGNSKLAVKFYTRVTEVRPEILEAHLGLAEAYIDLKLLDAAEDSLKKAEGRGANACRVIYLRGKCYLLRNKLPMAEAEFKKCKTVDCLNALGAVYDNQGEHKKAQVLYKQVIAKDPKYIDAYNNLGLSLMLEDNYNEAIFYLENACTLPGANEVYRGNLALAYGLSGQLAKAKDVYAQDFDGEELEKRIAHLEDLVSHR